MLKCFVSIDKNQLGSKQLSNELLGETLSSEKSRKLSLNGSKLESLLQFARTTVLIFSQITLVIPLTVSCAPTVLLDRELIVTVDCLVGADDPRKDLLSWEA